MLMALCVMGCGHDEPDLQRPHLHDNPADTTGTTTTSDTTGGNPADTTGGNPADTTGKDTVPPFTLTITAPRDYGYMGQTMSLHASTSAPASVQWRSLNTLVATVNSEGLVTLANTRADSTAMIVASANGVADTLLLHNRMWQVAAWIGERWTASSTLTAHRGDTIVMTLVDSQGRQVVDDGFHAGACQWSATSRTTDVAQLLTAVSQPTSTNRWCASWVIAGDAASGATFTVMARHGNAASSLSWLIR